MEKLRIISIGGLEGKIPDDLRSRLAIAHWDNPMRDIPGNLMPDAHAIVVIQKFSGSRGRECARMAAANRGGIPVLAAKTWNYVVPEILACDKLYLWRAALSGPSNGTHKEAKPAEPPTEALTDMGVTERQLWETHGDLLVSVVQALFRPNEKMRLEEFLPHVAEETGLSEADTKRMLPHLAIAGILDNPVGDTWRLLGSEFVHDILPAPEPEEEPETQRERMLGLFRGLNPGPYPSKYAIWKEAIAHSEFVSESGKPLSQRTVWRYIKTALERKIIKAGGDQLWIEGHNPNVKLTRIPEEELNAVRLASRKASHEEPKLKVSDDIKFLRGVVGKIDPPTIFGVAPEHVWEVILGIKKEIPAVHWDHLAENTCMAVLRKKSVSPKPIPKGLFEGQEWDALAWETLKAFKLEIMAPFLKLCYFDETLTCAGCGGTFLFSRAEKNLHYEKEAVPPKQCPQCRRKP